jgi:ribosomal protein S27E
MRFKHKTDTRGQRVLEDRTPAGMLNEEALTCKACGSTDMNAISLQGQLVHLEGEVSADNLVRDTRAPRKGELVVTFDKRVKSGAKLAEIPAPAGKKFLKLKCRQCGIEKTITISVRQA